MDSVMMSVLITLWFLFTFVMSLIVHKFVVAYVLILWFIFASVIVLQTCKLIRGD